MDTSTDNDLPLYMDYIAIYVLIIGSLVFIIYLYRFCLIIRRFLSTYIAFAYFRYIRTPLLLVSTTWMDVSRGEAILIVSLLISNIIPYILPIDTLERNSGLLSLLNIVLVSLGGGRNLITEYLELPLATNNIIHRWTGRIATGHAIVHLISVLLDGGERGISQQLISGYFSAGCLLLMAITTPSFLCIPLQQIGSKIHILLALACLCGLLWHVAIPDAKTYASGTAIVAASICVIESKWEHNQVTSLMLVPDQPLHLTPGDYFFIFLPGTLFRYNMRRSYPAVAVPKLNNLKVHEKPSKIMLLLTRDGAQGFPVKTNERVLLHGPFTQDLNLECYETVILIAKGLGIVDVLPLALSLTERKVSDMRAKGSEALTKETEASTLFRDLTRKVALLWWVCQDVPEWIVKQLKELRSLDSNNNLLNVHVIFPGPVDGPNDLFVPGDHYWKWENSMSDINQIYEWIKGWARIHSLSPGQTIIVASGDRSFLSAMRQLAIDLTEKSRIIRFVIPEVRVVETDDKTDIQKNQNQSKDLENGNKG